MIVLIKGWIHKFIHRKKVNKAVKNCMVKNEKILELIGDDTDYDGMGNYGRFPPIKKVVKKRKLHDK